MESCGGETIVLETEVDINTIESPTYTRERNVLVLVTVI